MTGNTGNGDVAYTYAQKGSTQFSDTVPTAAGEYTVKASIAETANYKSAEATNDFTIERAAVTPTVNIIGWTYGESANAPSVTGNTGNGDVAYTYAQKGSTQFSDTVPTAAGEYTVKASIAETANYKSAEATNDFTIERAAVTPTVNIIGWTYGESANAPSVTGNTGNGDVAYTYAQKGSTQFSDTVPTAAGEYTVKASIAETANYKSAEATNDFTIERAAVTPTVNIIGWTYGESANAPSVTGNTGNGDVAYTYAQKGSTQFSNAVPTAAGEYTVKASIAETDNYKSAEATKDFTIEKADPKYTAPTDLSALVGTEISEIVLPDGFSFKFPESQIITIGDNNFAGVYTPADTSNYNIIDPVTITVKGIGIHHDYVDSTCTQDGNVEYWEDGLGSAFSDENGTQRLDKVVIPAKDHSYGEPTYVWNYSDGKWTCTATRVCVRDLDHIDTETVTATSAVKKDATCEEEGDTTYTAEFENPAFKTQTKTVTDIEKLGHRFINFLKWVWDGFNNAIAWLFCDNNPDHVQTVDVPSSVDIVDEPTCTEDGYISHVATIDVAGKIYTTVNVETVDQLDHVWSEPEYTWADDPASGCMAIRICTREGCGEFEREFAEGEKLTYTVIKDATCEEDGLGRYTAAFENEAFETQTKDIVLEKLGHEWTNPVWNWTSDTKANVTLTCTHDKTHTKTVDAAVGVVVTEEPTEEKEGVRTYTAMVTVDGVEYTTTRTETIPKLEPAPDVPTPDVPTPDVPTPDVPTPDVPTPDVPTPDVPTPDVPTPDVPEKEINGILGDVNNDGVVDSADALLILRNSVGLEDFDETQTFLGDVNEDNENIDSSDALAVLRYSVGIIDIEKIGTPVSKTVA